MKVAICFSLLLLSSQGKQFTTFTEYKVPQSLLRQPIYLRGIQHYEHIALDKVTLEGYASQFTNFAEELIIYPVDEDNGKYSIWSSKAEKWLSAYDTVNISGQRTNGDTEIFSFEQDSKGNLCIKTSKGQYLSAHQDGVLTQSPRCSYLELFNIVAKSVIPVPFYYLDPAQIYIQNIMSNKNLGYNQDTDQAFISLEQSPQQIFSLKQIGDSEEMFGILNGNTSTYLSVVSESEITGSKTLGEKETFSFLFNSENGAWCIKTHLNTYLSSEFGNSIGQKGSCQVLQQFDLIPVAEFEAKINAKLLSPAITYLRSRALDKQIGIQRKAMPWEQVMLTPVYGKESYYYVKSVESDMYFSSHEDRTITTSIAYSEDEEFHFIWDQDHYCIQTDYDYYLSVDKEGNLTQVDECKVWQQFNIAILKTKENKDQSLAQIKEVISLKRMNAQLNY